jgi:hypothetical protein
LQAFSSCSEAYVREEAAHRYWGPTIASWAGFKSTAEWIGGFAGLVKLCREARVETAVVRWRQQGWVALEVPHTTTAATATVVFRPIVVPAGATHVTLNLQVAKGSCAQISLCTDLIVPIKGFSGSDAARACEDATAQVLAWAGKTELPADVGAGLVFRIELPPGAWLFGLTFASIAPKSL